MPEDWISFTRRTLSVRDRSCKICLEGEYAKNTICKTDIEFKGKRLLALDFIKREGLDPREILLLTDGIPCEENTGKFINKGTVLTICEEDLREISEGIFVYTPCYTMGKNPNFGTSEPIGAFIVGASDQGVKAVLYRASMKSSTLSL